MKVTIDQPIDENSDACLICKKQCLIDNENKGKEINIQNRVVWICKECLAPFERGRRIGQIELNSKVVQCLSSIEKYNLYKSRVILPLYAKPKGIFIKLNNI